MTIQGPKGQFLKALQARLVDIFSFRLTSKLRHGTLTNVAAGFGGIMGVRGIFVFVIFYSFSSVLQASIQRSLAPTTLGPSKKFLINFMGKGIDGAWDVGVVKALREAMPDALSENTFIAGNSSGALLASHFACQGFTPASLAAAAELVRQINPNRIPDKLPAKILKLAFGHVPEAPIEDIADLIQLASLDSSGAACLPTIPLAIIASNGDILDNRIPSPRFDNGFPSLNEGEDIKQMDWSSFEVRREGHLLGKACTYFVNQSMLAILGNLSYENRRCEIRMIATPADLVFAIQASVAEPTYFPAQRELSPEMILPSPSENKDRFYVGGFILNTLTDDLRKVVADVYSIGTGYTPLNGRADRLIATWFLASPNMSGSLTTNGLSLKIPLPEDMAGLVSHSAAGNPSPEEIMQLGEVATRAALNR